MNESEHKLATDVLNAALALMAILMAIATFLYSEFKGERTYPEMAAPLWQAAVGAFAASFFSAAIAFAALLHVLLRRGNVAAVAWAFAGLIFALATGIIWVGTTLMS